MRLRTVILTFVGTFAFVGVLASLGCSQVTDTPSEQVSNQAPFAPTTTAQDAATGGSPVYFSIVNAPGRGAAESSSGIPTVWADEGNLIDEIAGGAGTITGTDAGYAQAGFNITINTGTTPTLTGTSTGTTDVGQSTTQNPAVTTKQDAKGEVSASTPIGIAQPGGMVDQQATATGRGQTSDTGKESENDLTWAKLKGLSPEQLDAILALLENGQKTATTQPAATDGSGD